MTRGFVIVISTSFIEAISGDGRDCFFGQGSPYISLIILDLNITVGQKYMITPYSKPFVVLHTACTYTVEPCGAGIWLSSHSI